MKLFVATSTILVALFTSVHAKVDVVPNLLSPEECDEYLKNIPKDKQVLHDKHRFKTSLNEDIGRRLVEHLFSASSPCSPYDKLCNDAKHRALSDKDEIHVSSIVQTTELHQAHFVSDGKPLSKHPLKVGFVVLQDNKEAYFRHGDEKIPVEQGTFVAFDGGVPHQTVLNAKNTPVHLLGPFTMTDKGFALVGAPPAQEGFRRRVKANKGNGGGGGGGSGDDDGGGDDDRDDEIDDTVAAAQCSVLNCNHLCGNDQQNYIIQCGCDCGNRKLGEGETLVGDSPPEQQTSRRIKANKGNGGGGGGGSGDDDGGGGDDDRDDETDDSGEIDDSVAAAQCSVLNCNSLCRNDQQNYIIQCGCDCGNRKLGEGKNLRKGHSY